MNIRKSKRTAVHAWAGVVLAGAVAVSNAAPVAEKNVREDADLVGAEQITNSNGIRDDVHGYIAAKFSDDPKKRTAAIRFAQSNQRMLQVIAEGTPVTQELVTKTAYAGLCLASNFDKKGFVKQAREITARTFNTEARFHAHDAFSRQAYGMSVATSDNLDPCEAAK
jgi:hypothetical protein